MWVKISHHIDQAIDSNMAAIEEIKEAGYAVERDTFGAGLAQEELRLLLIRANELDTRLRSFRCLIARDAKRQKEADKL